MTDEQINTAIAEACGWTKINVQHRSGISPTNGLRMGTEFLPKYSTDLNAMHEAVKTRIPKGIKREEYILRLCGGDEWRSYDMNILDAVYCEEATAAQRAEAFLKTLNLWTYE